MDSRPQEDAASGEMVVRQASELADVSSQPLTPISIIASLTQAGSTIDVDSMRQLLDMHREEEDRQAKRALNAALAAFQAECPVIIKRKSAGNYRYAPLESIVGQVKRLLYAHGLSYHFDTEDHDDGITITCTITHVDGGTHSSKARMPFAELRGGANGAQKTGATITYGRRNAFCSALGIMTGDADTDGIEPAGPAQSDELISDDQADDLESLLQEVPDFNRDKFFRWVSKMCGKEIDRTAQIPVAKYRDIVRAAEAKRANA